MTTIPPEASCSVDGCARPRSAHGYCHPHYMRWKRHGDPLAGQQSKSKTRAEAFWSNVRKTETCWLWQGRKVRGYGLMWADGHDVQVHRWSYERFVGPIPDGLVIDHLCRNPSCVNPQHLEPVTSLTNTMRSPIAPAAINARKTHCIHGHPFTGENLIVWRGKRACRECKRASDQRRRAAK